MPPVPNVKGFLGVYSDDKLSYYQAFARLLGRQLP